MKSKYLLSLILHFIFILTNAQTNQFTVFVDGNVKKVDEASAEYKGVISFQDQKANIKVYEKRTNKLIMIGTYSDSSLITKNGVFSYFDDNEEEGIRHTFINNKKNGFSIFWTDGRISDSILYENDIEKSKILYEYHKNGILKSRVFTDPDSKISEIKIFDEEGNIIRSSFWEKGTGSQIYFYKNSRTKSIENYLDGKIISVNYFDPDGSKLSNSDSKKQRQKLLANYQQKVEEEDPIFPGGTLGFRKYFDNSFKPNKQFQLELRNIVVIRVTFNLNSQGKVDNIKIQDELSYSLKKAIENLFKNMPAWDMKGKANFGPILYSITLFNE